MLEHLLGKLNSQRIVLASASIRRKEILEMIGLKFEVIVSNCEEDLEKSKYDNPADYALATALLKTKSVAKNLFKSQNATIPSLVIGADTVVACEGIIYEKPKDKDDACRMLENLSGKVHVVHTGVILMQPTQSGSTDAEDSYVIHQFTASTEVEFAPLSSEIIEAYVATGEPLDKAGAYGIQGKGGSLVKAINGDFYNVVGFPLHRFCTEIARIYSNWSY
ncbi:hypothetical protein CHUAL_010212 [Chamberlinius hualienensis]